MVDLSYFCSNLVTHAGHCGARPTNRGATIVGVSWPWGKKRAVKHKILWVDLGDLGDLVHPSGPHEQWQDHGLGLLRTLMHNNGLLTDIVSTRAVTAWEQLARQMQGYEMLLMNVRSYTFPVGQKAAQVAS